MVSGCPSALDNRPLKFDEWSSASTDRLCVGHPGRVRTDRLERPCRGADRPAHRPHRPGDTCAGAGNQVDDLYGEIRDRQQRGERVLVTTLTKRMAEDLTDYYTDLGLAVRYLHSDIHTMERMDIIGICG
jgi:excinuclease ABC subunit B